MEDNKILFVCQDYTLANEGMNVVTRRNLRLLKKCGYEVDEILIKTPSTLTKLKNLLFCESYGYNRDVEKEINASLHKEYRFVFFDRSLFGPLIKKFSERGVHTICFFHNVEAHLSQKRLQVTKNPLYWFLYRSICRNESITTKYAEIIISISERDQKELGSTYGLSNVYLMPTSFQPTPQEYLHKNATNNPYGLFVGSDFFANQEGMSWFIREVAPNITCDIKVVGSICNSLEKLQLPHNVQLEGYVDDLNVYYQNAMCVISPIFSGSGLKTKTIEALRFGKTVFGTDEAFAGIKPDLFDKIGRLCNTKDDFVNAINTYSRNPSIINKGSLYVFNNYFSDEIAYNTLLFIISKLKS